MFLQRNNMNFDLVEFAGNLGVPEPEKFAAKSEILRQILEEANRQINLTRITAPEDFQLKHVADSLLIAAVHPEITEKSLFIADIGCGAGFPSLILALAFENLHITSIDSTGKKVNFVASAANALGLKNLNTVHGRAVELNRKKEFQNRFDIITARAVAPAPSIYRETSRFAKRDGRWIFYKTPGQSAEELPELISGCKDMQWISSDEITLPGDAGTRVFISGFRK